MTSPKLRHAGPRHTGRLSFAADAAFDWDIGVNAIYQSYEKASFANRFALSFSYDCCRNCAMQVPAMPAGCHSLLTQLLTGT